MKKYKSSDKARIKRTTYYDEKQRFNPEFLAKRAVRVLTRKLIRHGKIVQKTTCEICGDQPAECHHLHYDRPDSATSIVWVCRACHVAFHRLKDD